MKEVDNIYTSGQSIDILIITHHDDDHIKGIIDLLNHVSENQYPSSFIKRVVFNSPRKYLGKLPQEKGKQLSYKQAFDLEELLKNHDLNWDIYTDDNDPLILGDLTMDFLAPRKDDLKKYSSEKGAYLTGDHKCDWKSNMYTLEKYIDDKSQDKSVANKTSVVISLSTPDKKVLLTGDITPDRLEEITKKLFESNNKKPVKYDIVKLPHHGSYRSLSKDILENIRCKNFVISTNSKKYFLPNKRALLKVLKYVNRIDNEPINFIFNYSETINKLEVTHKEKKDYNFILTPNNEPYGASL